MRFLQFFNIYPQALQDLYSRLPQLHFASASQQVEAISNFGFSSGYRYAPYMATVGYEPLLFLANDPCSQSQWAREHGVTLKNPSEWKLEIAACQVDHYRPEILFITEPLEFDCRLLERAVHKPQVVLGWRAGPIPRGTNWSGFDAIATNLSALREMAPRLGAASSIHFWPGFERRIADLVKDIPKRVDVCFCGQWTTAHVARNALISRLAEGISAGSLGFSCALHISGDTRNLPPHVAKVNQGPVFGLDYYAALKGALIAIDARGTTLTAPDPLTGAEVDLFRGETGTNRMLEVTGVGTLLMAQHFRNLENYFHIGHEIVTFEDFDDLLSKVRALLREPERILQIASRGHQRCQREHSMEARALALDGIIKDIIAKKVQPSLPHDLASPACRKNIEYGPRLIRSPEQALAMAIASLQGARSREALAILDDIPSDRPIRNLEYVRALCLYKEKCVQPAIQAAEAELRNFPDSVEASNLIADLKQLESLVE
jgi:hypothetical protein